MCMHCASEGINHPKQWYQRRVRGSICCMSASLALGGMEYGSPNKLSSPSIEKYYDVGETIGTGTFAAVKLGINKKTKQEVAIKVMDKKSLQKDGEDNSNSIYAEISVLKQVQHPNIVSLEEMFETPNHIFLVMTLCKGGELFERICKRGTYSERDASALIFDILSSVQYLHLKGIVHRDLKPENMLFDTAEPEDGKEDTSKIKLTDFGLAKIIDAKTIMETACGTPGYVAPEVLIGSGYGPEVDMWSIGVILYILLCGFPPFYDENVATLFQQIIEGAYGFPSPYWDNISDSAKDLVCHLLDTDPATRYTAEQALKHPWVNGGMASSADMVGTCLAKLKEFNAKRRFKQAIMATVAANRIAGVNLK
eukprot:TRINITY_DN450_c0_g1_i11.p1 TRINITY_DN450_c0_g1~~TRINITY_DN450_c0_g1_i11.p1  ORF type:complete len:367 (+),score=60.13 TRINITY_DN450_c0_g1_i11:54-1154(+)